MRIRSLIVAATLSAAVAGVALADDDVMIPLDQAPAAVRATLAAEARGVAIAQVEKETEGGKVHYEAKATIDGKRYEIKVAEDGKLISKKLDDDDDDDHKHAATKPAK